RQRVVAEGAEQIRRLILAVIVVLKLAAQLEPVLVVPAEPRELVLKLGREPAVAGAEIRAAAEGERAHAARTVVERRVHEHGAVREQRVRRSVVLVAANAQRGLAEQD